MTIIGEIEKSLVNTLTLESEIFDKDIEFEKIKTSLSSSIHTYKDEVMKQIDAIKSHKSNK